jgi:WS/DGAT/MGAT family acyltransferase
MERLRGLDTAFLYLETPTNHLHVAWAAVLDTRAAPGAASRSALCGRIADRLDVLPALRKRLADPNLGYTQPDWIDVDVDPADHCLVHRTGDLEAVAADVLARPLDRHRPLWEIHVVEDLPEGRTGMIMKVHHALLDGPSGAELMVQLLDADPSPASTPTRPAPLNVDPEPTRSELARVARRRARHGVRRATAELGNVVKVFTAAQRWNLNHPDAPIPGAFGAPRTPFNRPITARRAVRFTAVPLDVLDKVRSDTGSTVNDVVLAVTGGALRRYLMRSGSLPVVPLVAMVPVSVPHGHKPSGGNSLSALVTTLGSDVEDPLERLARITRVTNDVKRRHDETGVASLVGLTDVIPPRTAEGLTRVVHTLRLSRWGPLPFNVVVSNVPGPDSPFYCNGALVESAYPMGPITDASALNVTVVSYRRQLAFGLVACPDLIPDIDRMRRDFEAEIDALQLRHTGV